MEPPPDRVSVTCGDDPDGGVKFVSVTFTNVPMGPDIGSTPLMVILAAVIVADVCAEFVPPRESVTTSDTWNVPADVYV